MLLKNVSALLGSELKFESSTNIQIQNNNFKRIQPNIKPSRKEESIDCEGLVVLPGFVNAHTHIGDSIGKDVTLNSSVDKRIHPVFGAKSKILKKTLPENLANFMKNSCHSMIQKGITTFVDFREGGLDGVLLLKKVLSETPIRSIILGRIEFYHEIDQIRKNSSFPKEKISELQYKYPEQFSSRFLASYPSQKSILTLPSDCQLFAYSDSVNEHEHMFQTKDLLNVYFV